MTLQPHLIQGTPEWLDFRKTKVTATDARSIAGVDPWRNNIAVWKDKLGLGLPFEDNDDMKRGRELEPIALEKFEELTGYIMAPKVVLHPSINYMMASLDGMEVSGRAIVEIKCPRPDGKSHECAMDGEIPSMYIPQLMHQMECSGLKKAYYFSYTSKSQKVLELHYDPLYVENLLREEAEFWNCVLTKTEPKSKKNYIHMDSKEWKDAATEYLQIKKQIADLERRQKTLKDSLFSMSNGMQATGSGVTLSKIFRKGQIDYSEIPELKTINLEKHRKPSKEEWRVL